MLFSCFDLFLCATDSLESFPFHIKLPLNLRFPFVETKLLWFFWGEGKWVVVGFGGVLFDRVFLQLSTSIHLRFNIKISKKA